MVDASQLWAATNKRKVKKSVDSAGMRSTAKVHSNNFDTPNDLAELRFNGGFIDQAIVDTKSSGGKPTEQTPLVAP